MSDLKFKGTKSDWIVKEKGRYYLVVTDPDGFDVVDYNYIYRPEAEANAYLMAAAPDLLAACQEFVRKVESGEAKSTKSYNQMKRAIEKALVINE